ncbi:MAG: DUF2946 family protein [Myxococcota bacterium]
MTRSRPQLQRSRSGATGRLGRVGIALRVGLAVLLLGMSSASLLHVHEGGACETAASVTAHAAVLDATSSPTSSDDLVDASGCLLCEFARRGEGDAALAPSTIAAQVPAPAKAVAFIDRLRAPNEPVPGLAGPRAPPAHAV